MAIQDIYVVYGYEGCSYCKKAKNLLEHFSIPYFFHPLETLEERAEFLDERSITGTKRTFPQIWKDGRYVGGYTELELEVLTS